MGKKRNGKRISVVIEASPLHELKAMEALRMCVGLTLRILDIHLFLLGDGLDAVVPQRTGNRKTPDFHKHLQAFVDLGLPVVIERESLAARTGLVPSLGPEIWSRREIFEFLSESDNVILIR